MPQVARPEIVPDERAGWIVMRDGHPQSHVNLEDPLDLAFEYVALIAAAVDATFPGSGTIRVTHVGGAGLTLPRWVQATRPGSPQIVLEPDAALTAQVRAALPLQRGHRIRVRERDGAEGVRELTAASADLVIVDAYADARVPAQLGARPFLAECARVLVPEGLLVLNLADEADGRYVDRVAAGAADAGLSDRAVLATTDVAKGRRFGNRILIASRRPLNRGALDRRLRRLPWPGRVLAPRPARAFTDDARPSPAPPAPERGWRVR